MAMPVVCDDAEGAVTATGGAGGSAIDRQRGHVEQLRFAAATR